MLSIFTCVQLFATLWTIAWHIPLSMGFSRQEHQSGLPCPPPEDLHKPGIEPVSHVCCIGGQVLYNYRHPRSPALCLCCVCVVAQLYLTLCDPVNCSLPGSSLYGILLATILEWVAMSSSKGFFQFRDETKVSCFAVRFFTVWATREVNNMSNKFQIVISINQKKKKTFWIYIEFMW